jgi:hypothetical protein
MYLFRRSTTKISRAEASRIARIAAAHGAKFYEENVKPGTAPGINNGRYLSWLAVQDGPYAAAQASRINAEIGA